MKGRQKFCSDDRSQTRGKLYSDSSFLLQNVSTENGEVKFAGAAIIEGKTKSYEDFK